MTHRRRSRTGPRDDHPWSLPHTRRGNKDIVATTSGTASGRPLPEGGRYRALTTSKNITLFWAQRRFAKTIPLDTKTNVGLTTTASGALSFHAFCATINVPETKQTNIFMTHIIPDEEDEESFQPKDPIEPPITDTEEPEDPGPNTTKL